MDSQEREAFMQTASEIEEVFSHMRKGVAENYYVAEVCEGSEYWASSQDKMLKVPEGLVGLWKMEYPTNLQYTSFYAARDEDDWVKCVRKEVVTFEYEEV